MEMDLEQYLAALKRQIVVPGPVAMDLESICRVTSGLAAGSVPDLGDFSRSLHRLTIWLSNPQTARDNEPSGWRAECAALEGIGGTITCRSGAHELAFSINAEGVPYLGIWRALSSSKPQRALSFKIEPTANGQQMVLQDGIAETRHDLPGSAPAAWSTLSGFLGSLDSAFSSRGAEPRRRPAAPAAGEGVPAAMNPSAPTPASSGVTIRCASCGSQLSPSARFCFQCGKPVPANAEGQARICPKCAHPCPKQGRFCTKCGIRL